MTLRWSVPISRGRTVEVVSTSRADGDFAVPKPGHDVDPALASLHRSIHEQPLIWLRQVHGATVVRAVVPGDVAGAEADGALTTTTDCPIAVTTADCGPVVLVSTEGVAVVHAGWKGALAGVVEAAAAELQASGGTPVAAILGPCIGPEHYEFGACDLDRLSAAYGDSVRSTTATKTPALDMDALIGEACVRAGWPRPAPSVCTSDPAYFSHRTRADAGRQTTVAWIESPGLAPADGARDD